MTNPKNPKIVIIDYGVGNLRSVLNAMTYLGVNAQITADPEEIKKSDGLILPGQGAFHEGMQNLEKMGLVDHIKDHIQNNGLFIGICLGFQLLFEGSEESPGQTGLGVFKGQFRKFDDSDKKVPHMGWNELDIISDPEHRLPETTKKPSVYFAHSYYLPITDTDINMTTTEYKEQFVSTIQTKNLLATQYHPEKSGEFGLMLLRNSVLK